MKKQTYILAISGGVDSVALLHKLTEKKADAITYVVAHFDHGIRSESKADAEFVASLAAKYGYQYESENGELGVNASEALAREKRYEFLRKINNKYNAEKIVTAHHEDDVLETMVLNILRGTGPRGLMPMLRPSDILRPLLQTRKSELQAYAKENNLSWREDSTNNDESYARNYVRKNIMPKLEAKREYLLETRKRLGDLYYEADMLLRLATPQKNILNRSYFLTFSFSVQREIMKIWLAGFDVIDVDRPLLERLVVAARTLPINKKIDVDANYWLVSLPQNVQIIKKV